MDKLDTSGLDERRLQIRRKVNALIPQSNPARVKQTDPRQSCSRSKQRPKLGLIGLRPSLSSGHPAFDLLVNGPFYLGGLPALSILASVCQIRFRKNTLFYMQSLSILAVSAQMRSSPIDGQREPAPA